MPAEPIARVACPSDEIPFVLYWPFGHLERIHLPKDVGGIPAAAARSGRKTVLLIGTQEGNLPVLPYRVITTGESRRLSINANLREWFRVAPILFRLAPKECLIYRTSPLSPFLVSAVRLVEKLTGRRSLGTRFMLKMDWDGSWQTIARKVGPFKVYLNLCAMAFDEFIVENTCAQEALNSHILFPHKVIMVPNGYDPETVPLGDPETNGRDPVILCVARICRVKAQDDLLRAFALLAKDYPEWSLHLVGPMEDGDFVRELAAEAERLNVAPRVKILGYLDTDQLRQQRTRASINALLSHEEGFSIAKLEAMAAGLPLVTSEAGCSRDLAQMGALVVPNSDVKAAAQALRLLMEDTQLRCTIARRQQSHLLSWDAVWKRLANR